MSANSLKIVQSEMDALKRLQAETAAELAQQFATPVQWKG